MLRSIFVLILMVVGIYYSLQAPFYALLSYLAYAYFRPEQWLWTNIVPPNFSFFLGSYLVIISVFSQQRLPVNKHIMLIVAFVVHSFLSLLFSEYFEYGWVAWKNFFNAITITYVITILAIDLTRLRMIFLVLVLFLGLEGAKQGWVYLLTSPGAINANSIPFLGDNNGVAVGMLMLVPIIAFLAQTAHRTWARLGFWFLLVGVLFRALSTYSRGGFLACIAMGGVYWLRSRKRLRVLLGLVVVLAIVYPALSEQYWERMNTIDLDAEETDGSTRGRLHFWQVAVQMANAHPLLGIGSNCYHAAYNGYDFLLGRYGKNRAVHSSYFGVLGETGYIGITLYMLNIFYAFYNCIRARKLAARQPEPLALQQCATALESSLIVFIVGSAFLSFQYAEMFWHYVGFTIALANIATQQAVFSAHADGALPDVISREVPVSTMAERA